MVTWLMENPAVLAVGAVAAVAVPAAGWAARLRRGRVVASYKRALDAAFVTAASPPSDETLRALAARRRRLPKGAASSRAIERIEGDVYQAVLDRILDDGRITREEAALVVAAEVALGLSAEARLKAKKEIFSAAYIEAIQDREITAGELARLDDLVAGLAIPEAEVRRELGIVREFFDTQALRLPFEPIPSEELAAPTQRGEEAYYQAPAQVLSRRKSKAVPGGYEYAVRRDGTMVLTNRRVFVVGDGTTNIRFADVGDVDVDMDEGLIEITRSASARPVVLRTEAPIYVGRAIDLLVNSQAGGSQ
jgi:hypothetical protein